MFKDMTKEIEKLKEMNERLKLDDLREQREKLDRNYSELIEMGQRINETN